MSEDLNAVVNRLMGASVHRSPYEVAPTLEEKVRSVFRENGIGEIGMAIDRWRDGYRVCVVLPEDVSLTEWGENISMHGVNRVVSVPSILAGLFGIGEVSCVSLSDRLGNMVVRDRKEYLYSFPANKGEGGGGGSKVLFTDELEVKRITDRIMGLDEQIPNLTYAEANILQRAAEGLPLRRNKEVARLVTRGFLRPEGGGFVLTDLGRKALELMAKMKAGPQWGGPP